MLHIFKLLNIHFSWKNLNGFTIDKWALLILSEGFLSAITVQIYGIFFILQVFFHFFWKKFLASGREGLREPHGGAKRAKHRAKRSPECGDP